MIPLRSRLLYAGCLALASFAPIALAAVPHADWHEAETYPWTQRCALTISAPQGPACGSVLVVLPWSEIESRLGKVGHDAVALVDPSAPELRLGEKNGSFVPFQVADEGIRFSLEIKPGQTRQIWLYAAPKGVPAPHFVRNSGYYNASPTAYRFFENDQMAFRFECGKTAVTNHLAIDIWGKTKDGQGAQARRLGELSYHKLQKWGMDIFHVGTSSGLGGIYLVRGDELFSATGAQTSQESFEDGPVMTRLCVKAPVKVGTETVEVSRTVTVWAGQRGIQDQVRVTGPQQVLAGLKIGIGLRNLRNEQIQFDEKKGLLSVVGAQSEAGVDLLGMGMIFRPESFSSRQDIPKEEGAHIVIMEPRRSEGTLEVSDYLAAFWDKDGVISDPAAFQTYLNGMAALLESPAQVTWGSAERRSQAPALSLPSKWLVVNPSPRPPLFPAATAIPAGGKLPDNAGQVVDFAGKQFLLSDVPLGAWEAKVVDLSGAARSESAFKVEHRDNETIVNNGWGQWTFTQNGLAAIEHSGKRLTLRETDAEKNEVKVEAGPVACRIVVGTREYLLSKNSPAWQVSSAKPYVIQANIGTTEKFFYSHIDPCWNPELYISFYLPKFFLLYPGDHATLFNDASGLGLTVIPRATSRAWEITRKGEWVEIAGVSVPREIKGQHHLRGLQECVNDPFEAGLKIRPKIYDPKEPARYVSVFAGVEDPKGGKALMASAWAPFLMSAGDKPDEWIGRGDWDGNLWMDRVLLQTKSPQAAFTQANWSWDFDADGSFQAKFSFESLPGSKITRRMNFHGDVRNLWPDGILDPVELNHPLITCDDWSLVGEYTHGSLFDGGIMSRGSATMRAVSKHYVTFWTAFEDLAAPPTYRIIAENPGDAISMNVYDLDDDGDVDVIKGERDHPDSSLTLDYGDMNPVVMLLFDPTAGFGLLNGAELCATYTDNFTEFHGGTVPLIELNGKKILSGGHDWPQMEFSVNDKPAPTHRFYMEAPIPGGIPGGRWIGDKWMQYYHLQRWVFNLEQEQKDQDGYSYLSRDAMGFRHWNACVYPNRQVDYSEGMATGMRLETPVVTYTDKKTGESVNATGGFMVENWDGKKVSAVNPDGTPAAWLWPWKTAMEAKWRRLTASFPRESPDGPEDIHACISTNTNLRYDSNTTGKGTCGFYASPILGNVHLSGTDVGHWGYGRADNPLFEKLCAGDLYDYQMYSLDQDIERAFFSSYLSYIDSDGDGIVDTYFLDENNDGLYEKRMWYVPESKNILISNGRDLAAVYRPLDFPGTDAAIENYPKLVEIYKEVTSHPGLLSQWRLVPSPAPPLGNDLVPNGSFEELNQIDKALPAAWTKRPYKGKVEMTVPVQGAIDGQRYASLSSAGGGSAGWNTLSETVEPEQEYLISGWHREKLTAGSAQLRLIVRSSSDKALNGITVPLKASSEWDRFQHTFRTPKDASVIWMVAEMVEGTGTVDFDGLTLTPARSTGQATEGSGTKVEGVDPKTPVRIVPRNETPVILANIGHAASARQHTVLDLMPTGYSRLLTSFSRRPNALEILKEPFNAQNLAGVDVVLFTALSPEKAITGEELQALKDFVTRGGQLIITGNDFSSSGLAALGVLAQPFGFTIDPQVLHLDQTVAPTALSLKKFDGDFLKQLVPEVTWPGRLYFRGVSVRETEGIAPLLTYDGHILVASQKIGKGTVYFFAAGDLISNAYSSFRSKDTRQAYEKFPLNDRMMDRLAEMILKQTGKNSITYAHP